MAKILLVTTVRWSCAERLAGALGACEVEALFPAGHAIAASRHLKQAHAYRALAPLKSLTAAIARAKPDLVIPCEDRAALLFARLHASGRERALLERSLGVPGRYRDLYDRCQFIAQAIKAGASAVNMLPAPDRDSLELGIACLGLPLVIKSDASSGGEGVIIAHTPAEARDAWRRLSRTPSRIRQLVRAVSRRDLHFLAEAIRPRHPVVGLQRFIAGRPATSSLACWQGEVLAANHFDVEVARHDTGPASVLTRRDCPQMQEAARRIARHFGLSGLIGLDFIRDARGQVHLLEINPRATPTAHLALGPRRDPCGALLGHLGVPASERSAVTQNSQIALFPQEWRRDRASPWLATAYHDVPWDDPAVVQALLGGTETRGGSALNDDLVGELAKFLAPERPADDWDGNALTIRQAAQR